jgi:hypothetical protein
MNASKAESQHFSPSPKFHPVHIMHFVIFGQNWIVPDGKMAGYLASWNRISGSSLAKMHLETMCKNIIGTRVSGKRKLLILKIRKPNTLDYTALKQHICQLDGMVCKRPNSRLRWQAELGFKFVIQFHQLQSLLVQV